MKTQNLEEKNKRTSLVPTIKSRKNRKESNQEKSNIINSNIPKEYSKSGDNANVVSDVNNYKSNHFNKDIEYIKNISKSNSQNNILEKVTIKNTTTKSVETRTPEGYYTNATQSDESVEEYTRYEGSSDTKPRLYDDAIDIYPSNNSTINKKQEIDTKPKMLSRSSDKILLNDTSKQTVDRCIELVKENGLAIQFVEPKYRNQMVEFLAVKQNGLALKYIDIEHQSESLCLEAVRQDGLSLKYVKQQTFNICKEAIKQNWLAFHYVLDKSYDICIEAVRKNGLLLQYMKKQDDRLCKEAIDQNPSALEFVLNQTEDMCRKAIYGSGLSLKYVKDKSPELCTLALHKNALSIRYIPTEIIREGLDLKDYVFIYSNKHILINSIKEVRGLRQIYLPTNENGYLIINAMLYSNYKTSFVLQKDDVYIDDYVIEELASSNHFVALINE